MSKFRRQLMMAATIIPPPPPPLPYDTQVEYLQSSGTQYIDTGINMQQIVVAKYTIQFTSVSGVQVIYGVYTDNSNTARAQVYINGTAWRDTNTNNLVTTGYSGSANTSTRYTLTSTTKSKLASNMTMYIFARNSDKSSPTPCRMKLYSMTMTSDGVLVRDFIPVVKDNVGYLYDRVSGELFANKGSGSFSYGNPVTNE